MNGSGEISNRGSNFAHCHVHTAFSMLDGKANVDDLVKKVAEEGQPAIAITDHGNTFGAYELYKAGKAHGVKPIIGSELYAAPGNMSRKERKRVQWGSGGEDDVSGGGAFTHLTVLSETTEGMHNLFKISSESFKSGYYYKARCLPPGQKVVTVDGVKNVENVIVGDVVLTHTGAYREVVETMVNSHDGEIFTIQVGGKIADELVVWDVVKLTGEHPVFIYDTEGLETCATWVTAIELFSARQGSQDNITAGALRKGEGKFVCVPKPSTQSDMTVFNMLTLEVPGYTYDSSSLHIWFSTPTSEMVDKTFPTAMRCSHHIPLTSGIGELLAFSLLNGRASEDGGFEIQYLAGAGKSQFTTSLSQTVKSLCGETVKVGVFTDGDGEARMSVSFKNAPLIAFIKQAVSDVAAQGNNFWGFQRAPESFTSGFLKATKETLTHMSDDEFVKAIEKWGDVISTQSVRDGWGLTPLVYVYSVEKLIENGNRNNMRIFTYPKMDNLFGFLPLMGVSVEKYIGEVFNFETATSHSYVAGVAGSAGVAVHNCDRELLSEHAKGLIATTGCPSGEVQTRLRLGQTDAALEAAAVYRDIFGKDNYYVEVMDHGLGIERRTREGLLWIADQLKLPLLATNDLHYVAKSDAPSHEAMLCVQSGSKLSDPKRFKFDADEFYLKSASEMRALFPEDMFPDACDNTLVVAERCNVEFVEEADLMPKFPVPEGETIDSWFVKEVHAGLERRYPNGVPDHHRELAEYEMNVIKNMGFPGYFLVTADFIMWAKKQGIRVGPGRGCLRGDTLIKTKDGQKEIRYVTENDYVMDGEGVWVHPAGVHMYDCEESLIALTVLYKGTMHLTADHKVLKVVNPDGRNRHEVEWVRADSVQVGDYLCDPEKKPETGVYQPFKVLQTHRNMLGDGRVYDLTIPTTNSYVANGVVVHNSAAGSLVAYALGITEIDPVEHNLIFERFLNPDRVSMPDIDVDFDDTRRGEVINYVTEKYGADKVAQIVTFSIVKAKAAVKDAARILDEPFKTGEKITKLVPPPIVGKDMPLWAAFDPQHERYSEAEELRKLYKADPVSKKVIDTALGLEGVTRQWGVHAAGIILSNDPLTDHIPVLKRESDGAIITQFDQKTCETLGLLKMDFLGLRNLTVIDEAVGLVKKTRNITVVPEEIPYDDAETYKLLAKGETLGVFQLDSSPMRALLKSMKPDKFEDISAVLALYRPGPMAMNSHIEYADRKNQRKPIIPIHPELKEPLGEILEDTYGLCVSGDTLIWDVTQGEQVRIDSLSPEKVFAGFPTYVMGDNEQLYVENVAHWFHTGKKDTLTLTVSDGTQVKVTPDHLVLTLDGWKAASELQTNADYVKHYHLVGENLPNLDGVQTQGSDDECGSWLKLVNVDHNPPEDVYDLSFNTHHNFLANNIVVHNCIYQEQVQKIAQKLAGYSLGKADLLRRAMGKKDKHILDEEYKPFRGGMIKNGYSEEAVKKLWDVLIPFADYAFNKCVAYDTPVMTPEGVVEIGNLLRKFNNGEKVEVLSLHTDGVRPHVVGNIVDSGVQKVHRVHLANGTWVDATPEHRFLTGRGYISVENVIPGVDTFIVENATLPLVCNSYSGGENHGEDGGANKGEPWKVLRELKVNAVKNTQTVPEKVLQLTSYAVEGVRWVVDKNDYHSSVLQKVYPDERFFTATPEDFQQKVSYWLNTETRSSVGEEVEVVRVEEDVREVFTVDIEMADGGPKNYILSNGVVSHNSHTVAYGTVSYWTAYLKANYPAEYMSALLTSVGNDKDKTALYINECRRMGLEVLPPDVNESGAHYTPVSENSIRVGLSAIRNVGENVVKEIIMAREENGMYESFGDFLNKVPPKVYNKRTIDSLIKAAAFSQLHESRAALSFAHAEAVDAYAAAKKSVKQGQGDMFSEFADVTGGSHAEIFNMPDVPEWSRLEMLGHEREMLGRYITDHPLRGYQKSVLDKADDYIAKLFPPDEAPLRSRCRIAGIVTSVGLKKTKKGDTYANVTIEDLSGAVDVMFLPTSWEENMDIIHNDTVCSVVVKSDHREDGSFSLLANSAEIIDITPDPESYSMEKDLHPTPLIVLTVDEDQLTTSRVQRVRETLEAHKGDTVVRVRVKRNQGGSALMELPHLTDHKTVLWELKGLFGEEAVILTTL